MNLCVHCFFTLIIDPSPEITWSDTQILAHAHGWQTMLPNNLVDPWNPDTKNRGDFDGAQ